MYNDEYEKKENGFDSEPEIEDNAEKKEECVPGREAGEEKAAGTGEVNFTMVEPADSSEDGGSQPESSGSQNMGGQYGYGSSQNARSQNTGSQNMGSQYGYGSSQNAGNQNTGSQYGYGSSQNAGNQNMGSQYGYGSSQNTGSQNTGSRYGYGNSRNAGGYGTQQPGGAPRYGSGTQENGHPQHYAPWQHGGAGNGQGGANLRRDKKKPSMAKRVAGITAAALLFGVVAGGAMVGINVAADGLRSQYAATESPTLAQAETVPAETAAAPADSNSGTVTYVATNDVSAIVEKAMPSVVAINSITEYQTQNWFGQTQTYEGKGSGSGIIIGESDTELLVVTNNHVVEGADTLSVTFNDGEAAQANIKGTDSENDLAVIAVALDQISDSTKSKIAVATIGDSDSLKVGQGVIAIGNALGYGQSVTVGYVSALDREVATEDGTTRNLLQTDAAINPGNSGGALLNMQGEVIGINSAKYSSTEVEGMGYAIPISKVQDIIDDLMTRKTRVQVEEANQGYLGIQGTDIDSNAATLYGMPQGIYVYKIMEDGAAASSTLREKDIITKFDGQSVRSMTELKDMLTYYAGGDTVDLTVQRLENGQYTEYTVSITLGVKPAEDAVQQ